MKKYLVATGWVLVLVVLMAQCQLRPATQNAIPTDAVSATTSTHTAFAAATVSTGAPMPTPEPTLVTTDFTVAVRQVSQRLRPAVVQITTEQSAMDQFNQAFTFPAGVGSGVIYDAMGHILTNNHVVEGAAKLQVSLPDGRSFEAKLIGRDPETDLAVIQIQGTSLPVAELGNPDLLQVGDWVVAIGNALALTGGPTVTVGVVGALGRAVQEPGSSTGAAGPFLFDAIQTDAPINPGNSGGPLANLAGQVIGINTLVAGQAGPGVEADGIGFAIAIDTAKPIADQLVATGQVVHPALSFNYVPLNPSIAVQIGVPGDTQGVAVSRVASGSLAAQAGLQRLDVITAVDGTKLVDDSTLAKIVNGHKPGDVLTLTVLRNGSETTIKLTLGQTTTTS